jgi:hypothetical protein
VDRPDVLDFFVRLGQERQKSASGATGRTTP